ncbi:carbohydrate ABC transporter permease [Bacillus sp. FSL K6-3431]|uniref:carbohydrate ABC transporter permease n=1 Tax=Bacillus sp. FSL K6-3431 TaxID=2921500 RepID=UPI0030F80CDA
MKVKLSLWHILLVICLVASFFPMIWMISTAFKQPDQLFSDFLNPIPEPAVFSNFVHAWTSVPLGRYLANSFFVSITVTAFQLFTSVLAAYAFTQYEFKGKNMLFYLAVASMLVPIQVTMLPNYIMMSEANLVNTYAGLILPQLANGMGIFLLRQAFRSVPKSLMESARVEGARDWKRLWLILFPAVKPTVISLGILFFINTWNEYLWPLLMITNEDMRTIPLALQMFISAEGGTSWGPMMAVAVLASLPPIVAFLLVQKHVISSFMHSGVKG